MFAPIVLFTYARPRHTQLTIEALSANTLAGESDLIIFSDNASNEEKKDDVLEVRDYLKTVQGFRSVTIHHRHLNYGLSKSIIDGVSSVLKSFPRIIVLEDDLVTSPYFLEYMNDALEKYQNDERVASIHGYVPPLPKPVRTNFFMRGADCWGWGTWRRGWDLFNSDGEYLLSELVQLKLTKAFDQNNTVRYTQMLKDQINGKTDSWAIRWHASIFLLNRLTLYPSQSLVNNIGNDGSGTNCNANSYHDSQLGLVPIAVNDIVVEPSRIGGIEFEKFYKNQRRLNTKILPSLLQSRRVKMLRRVARDCFPPILIKILTNLKSAASKNIFEGDYATWRQALSTLGDAYHNREILDRVLSATLKVKQGLIAFERDSVEFKQIEYSWPTLSGLMTAAAAGSGELTVLDFGGSLGSSYFQNKKFLMQLSSVRWNIVEQPHYVAAGKEHLQSNELNFFETIAECASANTPNVILLSSVLQYLEDPVESLRQLLELRSSYIIIDRTCFSIRPNHEMITVQRVPSSIYSAAYPCRFLSETKVINLILSMGYRLIERTKITEQLDDRAIWLSFIFSRE